MRSAHARRKPWAVVFGLCATIAGASHAAFILAPDQTSGTGLGAVNTILTVQRTPSESGCVGRAGGVDVIGPAACLGANTGGDESTGASQTQTRSIAELGLTTSDNLRAVFNANQPSGGPIRIDSLVLGIYSGAGTLLFTSSLFAPTVLPFTFPGIGTSGFVFRLDPADALAAQSFFANPANRIGLSFSGSMTSGGAETIYIADAGAVAPAAIDLSLTKTASAGPAVVGSSLTYVLTATNNGPNTATSVVVTDTLPASLNVVSITPSQGTCSRQGALITCALGTIDILQRATVQIVVVPTAVGPLTNTASVTASQADIVVANNAATQVTQVAAPGPTVSMPAIPIPTLTTWALAILGVAVALTALLRRRR